RGERDFATYSDWLDTIRQELSSGGENAVTFTRYATYVDEPEMKDPAHVLLDIDPAEFEQAGSRDPLDLPESATDVSQGAFVITVNETQHNGTLAWDQRRARYELAVPSLQDALFVTREGDRRELVASINADQALRVVPRERTTIYAHGSFFKPIIPATRIGS